MDTCGWVAGVGTRRPRARHHLGDHHRRADRHAPQTAAVALAERLATPRRSLDDARQTKKRGSVSMLGAVLI